METATYKGETYKFERVLGSGTYGTTWLAHKESGEPVAIKIFDFPNIDSISEDLAIELAALTSILPVCSPYSVCITNWNLGSPGPGEPKYGAIVMDYVNGDSLNKLISGMKISFWDRQNDHTLLKNLIKGIKYIHSTGIAHQDIKDENIMWDRDADMFRYIDFGLSCVKINENVVKNRKNWPCGTIGTFYTTSPDVALLHHKNGKMDWAQLQAHDYWSIGIVLLRWYTFPGNYYYYQNVLKRQYEGKELDKWTNLLLAKSNFAPAYYEFPEDLLGSEINKIPNAAARNTVRSLLIYDWTKRYNTFQESY